MRTRSWPTSLTTISLALVLALLFAAPAEAGTIQSRSGFTVQLVASPGERNDIVAEITPQGLLITDRGAPLNGRCPTVGPNTVLCPEKGYLHVIADDGDDVVAGDVYLAEGGPGNDHLVAGSVEAYLDGGDGDDVLEGRAAGDVLVGGRGRDRIAGGGGADRLEPGLGADTVDGGPGDDMLSYRDRETGVRVDLSRGLGPEGDVVTQVENVAGTYANDTLIGDGGPNLLTGRRGMDRIEGRGGADRLAGRGRLSGGRGDDSIRADRTSDVDCGRGRDLVRSGVAAFPTLRACERVDGTGPRVRIDRDRLTLSFDRNVAAPCPVRVLGREFRHLRGQTLTVQRPATVRIIPRHRCDRRPSTVPVGRLRFRLTS